MRRRRYAHTTRRVLARRGGAQHARPVVQGAEHCAEANELAVRAVQPRAERTELCRVVGGGAPSDLTEPALDPQPLGLECERLGMALGRGVFDDGKRRLCVGEKMFDLLDHWEGSPFHWLRLRLSAARCRL